MDLEIVLTGTGTPLPVPGRAGPGVLVRTPSRRLQFDVGRSTVTRLVEAGTQPRDLDAIFLTHHHSDHVIDLDDLVMTRWIQGADTPVPVVAPDGPLTAFVDRVLDIWQDELTMRTSRTGRADHPEISLRTFKAASTPDIVWAEDDLTVTAVSVHHEPVIPAVAYRVDAPGASVVISGDTRVCPEVEDLARGADVLVHEVIRAEPVLQSAKPHILDYHADSFELGAMCAQAQVGHLVLTHLEPTPHTVEDEASFAAEVRAGGWTGPLTVGRDLTTVRVALQPTTSST